MARRLYLYRSNRTEELASALAEVLRAPPVDPMRAERVVVQGRGMATWLSQELAKKLTVFTNAEFLYPRNFVQLAYTEVLDRTEMPLLGSSSSDALFWAVFSALGQLKLRAARNPADPGLTDLGPALAYVLEDQGSLRSYQLAVRIARCFDQYLVFRPELIRSWGDGALSTASTGHKAPEAERWQAALWRTLPEAVRKSHIASLELDFAAKVEQLAKAVDQPQAVTTAGHRLPERICVFGLSSLPPLYLRTLTRLADLVEVHLFSLAPSRVWFADQRLPRRAAAEPSWATPNQDMPPEPVPHSLVASLGRLGADFQQLVEEHAPGYQEPLELFRDPGAATALHALQRGILELDELLPVEAAAEPSGAESLDKSITLHSCHGPMREVEVLHDALLDLLAARPELAPQDIVVMASDIERYAPLVEAVFERPRGTKQYIPYRIADRSVRHDAPVLEGLRRVFTLVGSRHTASQLLDLLNLAPVAARFGIDQAELDTVAEWVHDTGVRWGVDAADRARHGQPKLHQNTWRFGLERLLLGYGLPGHGVERFGACLPYDEVEGHAADLAGKLAEFAETLFRALAALESEQSLAGWQACVGEVLKNLFDASGDHAWQHQRVLAALESLHSSAAGVGFEQLIPSGVLAPLLEQQLDEAQPAKSFLSGGVTFCAMVPMRSIPLRVVCLLGMDEDAFPRKEHPLDFELMHLAPRPGDRSRSLDDRYLFLEALLSARDRLIITYSGQSIRDNSKRPPSAVVDELLEHLALQSQSGPPEAAHARLVTEHPLQPFSRRYFDQADPKLFSFRADLCQGAASAQAERRAPQRLFAHPLPPPEHQPRLRVAELARFFGAPAEYLLRQRLGVFLRDDALEIQDREPLELSKLEEYAVGSRMFELDLAGVADDESLVVLRAAGQLPFGNSGAALRDELGLQTRSMADALAKITRGHAATAHRARIDLPCGVSLEGNLPGVYAGRLVRARFVRPKAKQLLHTWVEHLAWCAALEQLRESQVVPIAAGQPSVLLLRPESGEKGGITEYSLKPVAAPREVLDSLCRLMQRGLTEPLPFMPEASRALVAPAPSSRSTPIARAQAALTNELKFSPYLARCYPADIDLAELRTLDGELNFDELAHRVFDPLLAHLELR